MIELLIRIKGGGEGQESTLQYMLHNLTRQLLFYHIIYIVSSRGVTITQEGGYDKTASLN
jgi:hypothetical protein